MADGVPLPVETGDGVTQATDDCGAAGQVPVAKLAVSADGDATLIPATSATGLLTDVSRVQKVGTVVDANNSTTAPLAEGATFTGTATEVLGFSSVSVIASSDKYHDLELDYSPDGTNWDFTQYTGFIEDGTALASALPVLGRYVRLRVTQGEAGGGGYLRVQMLLHTHPSVVQVQGVASTQGAEALPIRVGVGTGNANIGDVDVASIAAGDNNIGNVDVVTLPSIPAGTNTIGTVDVPTAEQTSQITTSSQTISFVLPAFTSTVGVWINGTWTGTIQFQADVSGFHNELFRGVFDINRGKIVNSTSVNGTFFIPAGGCTEITLQSSGGAWTGAADIQLKATAGNGPDPMLLALAQETGPKPPSGVMMGGNDGSNMQFVAVDSAGNLQTEVLTLPALVAGSANIGDVDVLTVPAPLSTTGTGTEATALRVTIATDSTGVLSIDDNGGNISIDDGGNVITVDGTVAVSTLPALVAGTANIGDVDVLTLPALPAGTNNIGDVDVLTLPSLVAGSANIGDVDVLSLPALPAGTNNIGDVDLAQYTPVSGRLPVDGSGVTQPVSGPLTDAQLRATAVPVTEKTVLFKGRASTFRTLGRAGTTGQKILSLHNATGSAVTVTITKVVCDLMQTVVKAITVPPPIVRLWKVTVLPTNGTALTKNKIGGTTTSNASVTVLNDSSADGTGSGTTLTATLPAGTILTQEFAPRFITNAGYEPADRMEFLGDTTVTLAALEGVVLFLDYTLATQNPVTDMWIASIEWTEE